MLVALVTSACRVDTAVDVVVEDDGSGTVAVVVTLDEEAASKLPDLDDELRTEDLRAAGWRIEGPRPTEGGGARIVATRDFDAPEQLGPIMRQLGPPFRDFRLERADGFAETTYDLRGTVDLSRGIESFGDDELRQLLGGSSFGRTPEALALEAGRPLAEALRFQIGVDLPGRADEGSVTTWAPQLGGTPVAVRATSTDRDTVAIVAAGATGAAALLAVATLVLVLTGKLGTRRRNRRIWLEPEPHHRRLERFPKVKPDEVGGVRVRRED